MFYKSNKNNTDRWVGKKALFKRTHNYNNDLYTEPYPAGVSPRCWATPPA